MKLLLINPNSTIETTTTMVYGARYFCATDVELTGRTASDSLPSIDGHYDDVVAAAATCEILREEQGNFDAAIIACFDDPGLFAARELWDRPVVGIGEASMLASLMLGHSFAVLTTLERGVPLLRDLAVRYGLERRLAAVLATGIDVSSIDADRAATLTALERAGRKAIAAGAEVLLLGCGSMVGMQEALHQRLAVPIVDPVRAGVLMAQSLVRGGWATSKLHAFQTPQRQPVAQQR